MTSRPFFHYKNQERLILNSLYTKFRNQRVIQGEFNGINTPTITVFLGLFNGEKYFEDIFKQLTTQIDQDFYLIVVDNDSSDKSWEKMHAFLDAFPGRVKIVKNPFNVGSAGSLSLNYDLIETNWWCSWHQDDIYEEDYLSVFKKEIHTIAEDTVSISAQMGSISENGIPNAVPPRANWVLKANGPLDYFIANLRTQIVSFPSTAFRTEAFGSTLYPWHNSSFSDSELTLQMCANGSFRFLKTKTMNYRENSLSESHSISSREADFGVGVSLARVLSSSEFQKIAKFVEISERENFLSAVRDSISLRLGDTEYSKFIQFLAAENCMIAWDYSESSSIEQVGEYFTNLGTGFTPQLLSRILEFLEINNGVISQNQSPKTVSFLDSFIGSNSVSVNLKNTKKTVFRKLYDRFLMKFSFETQMYIGKFLLQLKIRLSSNHPWNFKWR